MMIKKLISSIFKVFVLASLGLAQANAQTTTAGILPLAKTQFLDQNGNPLSSGKVYFYSPGGTVAKTTWSDINKTTPNTNPVSLDAGGRAIVWGDGSYRQQVYDRSNNLIWDQVTAVTGASSGGGIGDGLAIGTILAWAGLTSPVNYQFAYGQALSRAIYPDLLTALTITQSVTCVGGSPIITSVPDTTSLNVGAVLEASCVSGSPTVISKTSSTVTLSGNASVSVTTNGTFYPYGNGDGTTTFNVPDFRGRSLVGRCNMGGVSCSVLTATYFDPSGNVNNTPSALNANGGSQSNTLLAANLPSHTHTSPTLTDPGHVHLYHDVANPSVLSGGGGFATGTSVNANTASATTGVTLSANTGANASGTSTPFSKIMPVLTTNYIIKVTPNSNIGTANISQLQGGSPNKLTGTDNNGIFGNINLPSGLTLVSSNLNFLAQACAGSTWLKSIDTNGTFTCTQPAFSNISGTIASAQLPLATNAAIGGMEGDGTTITCVAGVCTSIAAASVSISASGSTAITGGTSNCVLYDNAGNIGCLFGAFENILNAQTGNYTITSATGDCGKLILASGGQNTITLNAVAGFPANCIITIKNNETYTGSAGRAKILAGFPSDVKTRLWPLQTIQVAISNGAWVTIQNPGRWRLPDGTTPTIHVDKTNGNNNNDGLATTTGAVQDAQTAWSLANYQMDTNATVPIIAMACAQTHTVGLATGGTPLGTNLIQVSPDGNCAFTWSTAGACLIIADLSEIDLRINYYGGSGALLTACNTTSSASTGNINLHNDVVIDVEGSITWNPSGVNDDWLYCDGKCQFTIANGITQATGGGSDYMIRMSAGGHGTFSGATTASASGGATGLIFLNGGATLNLGITGLTGWSSIGTTKVYGNATLWNNGVAVPGGVAVGASAANCSSFTGSC